MSNLMNEIIMDDASGVAFAWLGMVSFYHKTTGIETLDIAWKYEQELVKGGPQAVEVFQTLVKEWENSPAELIETCLLIGDF